MMYDEEKVAKLLPGVWDTFRVLNGRDEHAPDDDMPKAASDPRRSDDQWAECADIQRAWALAPLTIQQRRVLFLKYAMDMPRAQIERLGRVSARHVPRYHDEGMSALVDFLNFGFSSFTVDGMAVGTPAACNDSD